MRNWYVSAFLILFLGFPVSSLALTIQITVVDDTGASLPGVLTEAHIGSSKRRAVTDAEGRLELADMPAGIASLRFTLDGLETLRKKINLAGPDVSFLAVMKIAEPEGEIVVETYCDFGISDPVAEFSEVRSEHFFGVVESADGPIAEAEVYVYPCADPERKACRAITLKDGSFAFSVPVPADAEQMRVTAVSSGYWSPVVETTRQGGRLHLEAHPLPAPGEISCLSCGKLTE